MTAQGIFMNRKHLFSLLLLFMCAALAAYSQNVTASLTGVVRDATGGSVPNATVRATNTGTNAEFQATTNAEGQYTIRTMPVGVYRVVIEAPGFKRHETSGIRLQVDEVARVDATLDVGAAAETVTVSGAVVPVDTETSTLKTVVDQRRIEELPLNGRNPTQLMRLVAGVTADPRADVTSGTTYPGVTPVSVNGSRSNTTNYVLDGANNNDHYTNAPNPMPNPDALQEFSVQTNNFSAEFGRNSGAVVNAITKSGTNEFHGSAFEFVRNNALNATNFFSPVVNGQKQSDGLKRNQFGATLGGPVTIPKIYNGHDKTFFFFSYQGTRLRQAPVQSQIIVPSAAMRSGDFSALMKPLNNPLAGGTFANNRIPAADISPISLAILQHIPLPTSGNTTFAAAPNNFDEDQWLVRGDQQISNSNRLSVRWFRSFGNTPAYLDPNNYLANNVGRTWLNQSVSVTDTQTIGANFTNQVLFSFNRTDGNNVPIYPDKSFHDLGINIYTDDKPQWYVAVSGYWGTLNTGDTNRFLRDETQFTDTARWTHGQHQFSFGGEYGHGADDVTNNFRANGRFTFNGGSAPFTGDSFADFLLGKFASIQQGAGEYRNTRFNRFDVFFDDAWKIKPRFTLNLGIRWEPFLPYTDLNNRLAAWYPGQQSTRYVNAPLGVVFPGDAGIPAGGFPTTWRNFAPRVGFAWDVFGDGKTSVRGGYGVFYDQPSTIAWNSQADQAPFGTVLTTDGNASNSLANPYAGAVNPFPSPLNPPSDAYFPQYSSQYLVSPGMRNPYMQSWNLTIERQIAGNFVVRGSYVGSKGTNLVSIRELNPAVYAPGVSTATTNQRRIFAPAMGSTNIVEPGANSSFNALQLTLERRFAKGFSILTNYQFGKSIDESSANKGTGINMTDPFNRRFDRGRSDFDRTHVFNFSGLWELPIHFQNRGVNALLGGWSLNSIVSLMSGYPFTVTSGVDNARTGTGGQRAILVGDPNIMGEQSRGAMVSQYLNRAAFAPNPIGTLGTLGRNIFEGPGFANVDLGLAKHFQITERVTTTFRFETFNAFNHPNFDLPNATLSSGNFMKITTAYDPRILQFALRMTW
jgi:outer membrane receptor protein involved in Fe transport